MKNKLLSFLAFSAFIATNAQTKSDLSAVPNLLSSPKQINVSTNGYDLFQKPDFNPAGDYTIEVKAKVNSSANRGLDVEAVNASGQGFRVSSSTSALLDFSNILTSGTSVANNDNTALTTFRYVMQNNNLNIYKNNASTPINAAPIAKASVKKSKVDDGGFENGGWSNWVAAGSSVGTVTLKQPAEILQYSADLSSSTVIANSGKALFLNTQSGTNGDGWYYSVPVSAGVYEFKVKSLPYKLGTESTSIKNTLIRVRSGIGVSGTSLTSVYLNGHSGSGSWINTTLQFEVPAGETNVSITIERSNNNKIYFDDFELNKLGDNLPVLGSDNSTDNTGIYDNVNLLKTTTSFEGIAVNASPGGLWEANQGLGAESGITSSARIFQPNILTNLKDGTNTFLMRFEQSYTWFSYPVTLQPNKVYKLSYLHAGNSASQASYIVAVCNAKNGATASTYYSKSTVTPNATALVGAYVTQYFTTPATLTSDQIYLSFYKNGSNTPVFHVDKLVLLEASAEELNNLIVGKNFYNGAANMEIESVKVTDGAYYPATVPDAPSNVQATAGNGKVSVAFDAPSNGGLAITNYTVTATPGNLTATGTQSPITITGLTNGTAYTFTVTASNGIGSSVESSASTTVTPHQTNHQITISSATNSSSLTLTPVSDLVVSSNKLTINAAKQVNSITVAPGAQLELTAGNPLSATNGVILQSDNAGTATLVDNTTSSPQAISGVVQQRFEMTTPRNWYLTSPVVGATVPVGQIYYSYVEAGDNNDLSALGTAYWKPEAAGNSLIPAKGYIAPISATTTMEFSGTFNTGEFNVALTRTPGKLKEGFNLVANPYPSYVDWSMVDTTAAKILSTVWYRTKTAGDAYTFDTYNGKLQVATNNGANLVSNLIPPMQAFWVRLKATETEGTLTFTNAMRKHADNASNKFKVSAVKLNDTKLVRLKVSNATSSDETILGFNAKASDNFDSYDSPKMFNSSASMPEIFTQVATEKLVINGMTDLKTNVEIPLGFVTETKGDFSIKASELKNIDSSTRLILIDKQKNVEFVLNDYEAYFFSSDSVAAATDRFSLIFRTAGSTTDVQNPSNVVAQVYVNGNNKICMVAPVNSKYAIYNALGQVFESGYVNSTLKTQSSKLSSGVYVVTVGSETAKVIVK